jgi:hypothetical protein
MQTLIRLTFATLMAASVAACATTPAADLTLPAKKPCDAKTALESGRRC